MKLFWILLALIYALSPYDLLPDFFPVWGRIDDLVVIYLLWRYVLSGRKGPSGAANGSRGQGSSAGDSAAGSRYGTDTEAPAGSSDPYAVLGVGRDASREEIQKAYRTLASKYHPDKVAHLGDEFRLLAEKRFKEIQQAYNALEIR